MKKDYQPRLLTLSMKIKIIFLLFILTNCSNSIEQITIVSKPEMNFKNEHYVSNRQPLVPSSLIKLPVGSIIHNIEMKPGAGGQLVRSAGTSAQIISKEINQKESLKFIKSNFEKIEKPNEKILFDIANFYKNAKEYEQAIKYYTKVLGIIGDDLEIKSDLFYRRGASNERMGNYEESDRDMLLSLEIDPDDAYVLNYLAYSWLERDHKIKEAMEMLEKAYSLMENDPYIIDSIGWAYFLTDDYVKAETYLKRAVELMPDDAIVNDHYGDILWKLGRKIQARYFWKSVSKMEDVDEELLQKINLKIIKGL